MLLFFPPLYAKWFWGKQRGEGNENLLTVMVHKIKETTADWGILRTSTIPVCSTWYKP